MDGERKKGEKGPPLTNRKITLTQVMGGGAEGRNRDMCASKDTTERKREEGGASPTFLKRRDPHEENYFGA